MHEGIAVLCRRLRHDDAGVTEMRLPASPGHTLWLFTGSDECYQGRVGAGSLRFRSDPGLGLIIPPDTASEWRVSGPAGAVVVLQMASGWLAGLAEAEALPAAAARPTLRLLRRDPQLMTLLRLFQAARGRDGAESGFCGHWAALVGQRLLRLPPDRPAIGGHALAPHRLAAVKAHVAQRLGSEITLAEMAALAGLSPAHFSRAFRRETGQPPYAWLLAQRLAAAMQLLAETDLPMAHIAREVGVGTPAHFSTRFRRATGMSPQEWRAARRD